MNVGMGTLDLHELIVYVSEYLPFLSLCSHIVNIDDF